MKKLTYIGRFSGVDTDGIGTVKRGQTVDVPEDLAKELLKRESEWELAHIKMTSKQEAKE